MPSEADALPTCSGKPELRQRAVALGVPAVSLEWNGPPVRWEDPGSRFNQSLLDDLTFSRSVSLQAKCADGLQKNSTVKAVSNVLILHLLAPSSVKTITITFSDCSGGIET